MVLVSEKQAILDDARNRLSSLNPRPSPEDYEQSQKERARIDQALVAKLTEIMRETPPSGVDAASFKLLQTKKQEQATAEAEAASLKYVAVVELEQQHRHLEDLVHKAELAVVTPDPNMEEKRAALQVVRELRELKVAGAIQDAFDNGSELLDLSDCDLDFISESIGRLTNLISLDLSKNRLEILPDSVAGLKSLTELHVSHNQLRELPDSIGSLEMLRHLNVASNRLTSLPSSLRYCRDLEVLNVNFNGLTALPASLGQDFPNLCRLSVGLNKLSRLPDSIGQLGKLKYLDVHFNHLTGLPKSIGQLHMLEELYVSDNFANFLELPGTLGQLAKLRVLDVKNNQIEILPPELGHCEKLQSLYLAGNPWKDPPLEVTEKLGQPFLLSFLKERLRQHKANRSFNDWAAWFMPWQFTPWLSTFLTGINVQFLLGASGMSTSGEVEAGHEGPLKLEMAQVHSESARGNGPPEMSSREDPDKSELPTSSV